MTDNEFFKLDQEQWYCEFVEHELPQNIGDSYPQDEKNFLDLPF